MGKYEDALAELDKAATFAPEGLRSLKLRSQIYFEKKRYADAVPVLQKAEAMAPKDPFCRRASGMCTSENKDYPNAVRELIAGV